MPEFQYFPVLRDVIIRETLQLLDEKTAVTKEMIHILLEMEKAYKMCIRDSIAQSVER